MPSHTAVTGLGAVMGGLGEGHHEVAPGARRQTPAEQPEVGLLLGGERVLKGLEFSVRR